MLAPPKDWAHAVDTIYNCWYFFQSHPKAKWFVFNQFPNIDSVMQKVLWLGKTAAAGCSISCYFCGVVASALQPREFVTWRASNYASVEKDRWSSLMALELGTNLRLRARGRPVCLSKRSPTNLDVDQSEWLSDTTFNARSEKSHRAGKRGKRVG